jgi:hypothetical protein
MRNTAMEGLRPKAMLGWVREGVIRSRTEVRVRSATCKKFSENLFENVCILEHSGDKNMGFTSD